MELIEQHVSAVAEYQPFYAELATLEKENSSIVFDYETKKGNAEARSYVFKLRKSKSALEKTRVAAKAESLKIGRAIDSEAKDIEARIEAMIKVHQVKLDEIEKRESDRIAAIQVKLDALSAVHYGTSADLKYHIATLEAVVINDKWQEFVVDAAQRKDASIVKHRELLAIQEKAEFEAAELEKLRKEAAERAQKDRDEAIAKAAAEKALVDAALKAEQEALKAKKAIEDAELKAKQEREAAGRRELELKLKAEQLERMRLEAEQKAIIDAENARARAEAEKELAIKQEQDRVAAIAKAEAEAQAKREANKAHLTRINRAAMNALIEAGLSEDNAKLCIQAIAKCLVPNVVINY